MLVTVLFGCVMEFTFNFLGFRPHTAGTTFDRPLRSVLCRSVARLLRNLATPQLEPRCFAAKIRRLLKTRTKHDPHIPAPYLQNIPTKHDPHIPAPYLQETADFSGEAARFELRSELTNERSE